MIYPKFTVWLLIHPLTVGSRFCQSVQLPVLFRAVKIPPKKRISKTWQGSLFSRSHFLFFPLFERFFQINNLVYF